MDNTLEPSQTASECLPYCSIMGRIPVVTMRCARLKFWSISGRVRSGQGRAVVAMVGQFDGLLTL